jgi:hypothetical protein
MVEHWKKESRVVSVLENKKIWLIVIIVSILLGIFIPTAKAQELKIDNYDVFYSRVFTNWQLLDIIEQKDIVKKDIVYEIFDNIFIITSKRYGTISLYYSYTGENEEKYTYYQDLYFDLDFFGSIETIKELNEAINIGLFFNYIQMREIN